MRPAAHRGEWRRHTSGARLYDDTYNANPASMLAALETLGVAAGAPAGRRPRRHARARSGGGAPASRDRAAGRAGRAELLVAVGREGALDRRGSPRGGLPPDALIRPPRPRRPEAAALRVLAEGDVVVLKASRGIGLDRDGRGAGAGFGRDGRKSRG